MRVTGRAPTGGQVNEMIVGSDGRLYVDAVSRETRLDAAENGNTYWVHSGFTALTNASGYSGLLFIQNDSAEDEIHIGGIRTCGDVTGHIKSRLYKNPTTGTLISGGTTIIPVNAKFLSNNSMVSTCTSGADGLTITDGTMMGTWTDGTPGHSTSDLNGTIILGPGDTIAVEVQPSVDMSCCTTWQVWIEPPHV